MPRWFILTMLALLSWGVWAILSKLIGGTVTAAQSQALSTLGMIPVIAALAFKTKLDRTADGRRGMASGFFAGALTCAGNVAYYHALNVGGKASTVVPLTALYPLVTVLLAVLFLRERLNKIQFAGIGLALAAIYLFNVATIEGAINSWLIFALIPIALWGVSGLVQKISTNRISGELSTLCFLAAFVPVAAILLAMQPLAASLSVKTWVLISALGLSFSLGNLALLAAFANSGKASVIAPLAGLYPAVSVPIALFFFNETISARESTGILLAIPAAVLLAWETPAPASGDNSDFSNENDH